MAGIQWDDEQPKSSGIQWDDAPATPKTSGIAPKSGLAMGLRDPLDAGAQMLYNLIPKAVQDAGNKANNWIADKTGLTGRLPEGGFNDQLKQQEAAYQANRAASGETGFDGDRLIGNVVTSIVPGAGVTNLAKARGLGAMGQAAMSGGATAMLVPETGDGDFWTEKAKQAAGGALAGAGTQKVIGGLSRLVSPKASTNQDVKTLLDSGVRMTPAQATGGWLKAAEEKARSLPILGDAITASHKRAGEDLNKAVLDRGMARLNMAIGGANKVQSGGSKGLQELRIAASDAYDNLLPKMMADTTDPQFVGQVSNIRSLAQSLQGREAAQFDSIIQRELTDRLAPNGVLSGGNLKSAQAALRDKASTFSNSTDAYQRELGGALKQIEVELRGLVERSNPQYAKELSAINEAYRIMKTAQRASSSVAADDGVFTAAQLHNAVKVGDKSKDKRAFAEGTAYLQDLSGAGKRVLANQYPDSGTAGRIALGAGGLASGMASPAIPAGLIAGSAAYIPAIQKLLTGAVASRPQNAQLISNEMTKAAPYLAAPSTVLGGAFFEK